MRTYKYFPALKANARTITLTCFGKRYLKTQRLKRQFAELGYELIYTCDADGILKEGK